MALRRPITELTKRASQASVAKFAATPPTPLWLPQPSKSKLQKQSMATVAPPVTRDATSSRGPTAIVFMNMGGPSTTDEVGGFLSRLFVCYHIFASLQH